MGVDDACGGRRTWWARCSPGSSASPNDVRDRQVVREDILARWEPPRFTHNPARGVRPVPPGRADTPPGPGVERVGRDRIHAPGGAGRGRDPAVRREHQLRPRRGVVRHRNRPCRPSGRLLGHGRGPRRLGVLLQGRRVGVPPRVGAHFPVTTRIDGKIRRTIAEIPQENWTAIRYPRAAWDEASGTWVSDAQITEPPHSRTAQRPGRRAAGVCRVKDLNPKATAGQGELFTAWRYHAVLTDRPFILPQAEEQHRDHAVVEQVFADLVNGPLAHPTSGPFYRERRLASAGRDHAQPAPRRRDGRLPHPQPRPRRHPARPPHQRPSPPRPRRSTPATRPLTRTNPQTPKHALFRLPTGKDAVGHLTPRVYRAAQEISAIQSRRALPNAPVVRSTYVLTSSGAASTPSASATRSCRIATSFRMVTRQPSAADATCHHPV